MFSRILEPEVMDSAEEARDYDAMDHRQVNQLFVTDFLTRIPNPRCVLDVGTGTAQIPIELCQRLDSVHIVAIDLAEHMLALGVKNVQRARLSKRIELQCVDAKATSFEPGSFDAVLSNSIIHHIPQPQAVLAEMVRVVRPGGAIFVRDLLRPQDQMQLDHLVAIYAGDANAHQKQMFADSLRAALTLEEIRDMVRQLGKDPLSVQQTSDRHWTWSF